MLTRTTLASLTLLAASAQAGTGRNCSESHVAPRMHKRAPNTANKVVVQMFGWSWKSIAAECESFLGPAGVGFVQVNPPQEHLSGDQWWVDYQAVSYQIQSKRGSRADFAEMIGRCKNVGVNVAVDAIWNHMAGVENGEFAWRKRRYQRLTSSKALAQPEANSLITTIPAYTAGTISTIVARMTNNDDIQNWGDRNQIWNCELVNLADLNTGSDYVRDKLAAFTNDLLSMGVEGLRIDAAKHISPDDIRQIMNRLSRRPAFITQEIVDGDGSMGGMYTQFGDVQEFRYPQALKAAFGGGGIAGLRGVENRGWLASNSANVFVTNHDQERGGDALTYKSGSNTYNLAHVFMLSYPYGTPTILSSYVFDNNDAGAPNGAYGTCYGEGGVNGWLCQHRWTPIAGMIKFFNKVGTNNLNNWVQGSNQQIAFGRGNAGFVVINNEDWAWTGTFKNTLPSATYCDVITGKKSGNSCTGGKVTISNGSFTVTVPGRSAVAYHIGAKY